MDPEFWLQRWSDGRIGFHQAQVNALLETHWPALALAPGGIVLVPLAGKSLDMAWLADRGHPVLGVELSDAACAAFFDEHGLVPVIDRHGRFLRRSAGGITLLAGDIFDLADADLAGIDAAYDRAALIALPPGLRRRYADALYGRMPAGSQVLLVTLEYPPGQKQGPPFSVDADEVAALFARDWHIALLERRDILYREPGFQAEGVTDLHTSAWHLRRR